MIGDRANESSSTTPTTTPRSLNVLSFGRISLIAVASVAAVAANVAAQAPAATPNPIVASADSLMRGHSYAAAAQLFEQLTQQHPEQLAYWARLGVARHLGGERDGAMAAYRKAIQLGAGQTVKYNIGALFALRGMPDSAFYWLGEAVKVGFANEQQLAGDDELASLRRDSRYAALVDRVHKASAPCMYRPESRMFDFWVGEWDVTNLQGQPAGKSSVQLLLEGCALYENWSTPNGGGKSLNSYNPDLKMWQQFWTAQTGQVTEYRTSEWVNGSLRYTARQLTPAPSLLRMTFTPLNKDLVRQMGELSTDEGKTWSVAYDLYYHRRK